MITLLISHFNFWVIGTTIAGLLDFFFFFVLKGSGCLSLSFSWFISQVPSGWVFLGGCVTGTKFILQPFDLVVQMTSYARSLQLSEVLACSPFGLERQADLRLGGPCRIRCFRLLCPFEFDAWCHVRSKLDSASGLTAMAMGHHKCRLKAPQHLCAVNGIMFL
jgi:hypothetical protein